MILHWIVIITKKFKVLDFAGLCWPSLAFYWQKTCWAQFCEESKKTYQQNFSTNFKMTDFLSNLLSTHMNNVQDEVIFFHTILKIRHFFPLLLSFFKNLNFWHFVYIFQKLRPAENYWQLSGHNSAVSVSQSALVLTSALSWEQSSSLCLKLKRPKHKCRKKIKIF